MATLINKIRGVIYGHNSCQKSQIETFISLWWMGDDGVFS
jgi:hypothetical protein